MVLYLCRNPQGLREVIGFDKHHVYAFNFHDILQVR